MVRIIMQTKPMLPDEAITKAYDEMLSSWRDEPNDDECPICIDEKSDGGCSCHTGFPPCSYCCYECRHTKGEVFDYQN